MYEVEPLCQRSLLEIKLWERKEDAAIAAELLRRAGRHGGEREAECCREIVSIVNAQVKALEDEIGAIEQLDAPGPSV